MCHINTHGNIQDNGDMNSLVTGLLLRQGKPFSKEKIINVLNSFKGLTYEGRFYECTEQYNHPMAEYNFYSKDIDGRFRIRQTIGDNLSKCMITWKRRLPNNQKELIHNEEEIEISIKPEEYNNLTFLLKNVLHLNIIESYERYRSVFKNDDVEIVVDEYPFGTCIEIENKNKYKNANFVIENWLSILNFNINDAYTLSWDDKYSELCKKQNKQIKKMVRFDEDMPKISNKFPY